MSKIHDKDESTEIPSRLNKFDRADMLAGWSAGIPVSQLAREYRRARGTIYRLLAQARREAGMIGQKEDIGSRKAE